MKMEDLIVGLNEYVEEYVIIQGPRGYRMDADPTHTREDWEDVWTDDISKAFVFTNKAFRKFMPKFAQVQDTNIRDFKSVPVQLVDGVPTLPAAKKGFF